MNRLVGERLSIINKKAQTTRHRIMGIVNEPEWQIVYSDTPGVLDPAYKLQEGMMKFVRTALQDADLILMVTDTEESDMAHPETFAKIAEMEVPVFILINKVDLADQAIVARAPRLLAREDPTRRRRAHQRPARLQCGSDPRARGGAPCRESPSLFLQGRVDEQAHAVFHLRNHPRENPHPLQTRNSILGARSWSNRTSKKMHW